MGYLFLMTFAGSALFVGYLCWGKILGKSITQCMKYKALMIVMLAYTVPWIWIGGTYRYILSFFLLDEVYAAAKGLVDIANIETKEAAYQTKEYQLLMLMTLIWFMVAVLLLLIRTVKFLRKRHEFHTLVIKCEDENLEQTLGRLREELKFRRRPEIAWTRVDNETFTLGAVKPVIFLQKKYAEGDLYWILKHEMTHIVGMDICVKLLLEFVCCLHWFNPLIYFLGREIKYLSETSCDERVIKGCTETECQVYIDLLDRSRHGGRQKMSVSSALEGGNEIDRRIALMKKRKQVGHREKVTAICAFCFLVFLDSLTVLVYPKVYHVKNAVIEAAEDSMDGGNLWTYDYVEDGYDVLVEAVLYDEQFVDGDGQIYPAIIMEESTCNEHNTVSGVVQMHMKDGKGGCSIETYEGSRCMRCGNVWSGDFLHKTEKTLCTH